MLNPRRMKDVSSISLILSLERYNRELQIPNPDLIGDFTDM